MSCFCKKQNWKSKKRKSSVIILKKEGFMKKRRKLKKKGLLVIALLLGTFILTRFFWTKPSEKDIKYSNEAITIMKEKNVYQEVTEKDYSKTVERMLESGKYEAKYLNQYIEIKETNHENFENAVNALLDKNYTPEEINDIFEYLSDANQNKLLEMEHVDLKEYIKISNLEVDKISRYETYRIEKNTDVQDAVTKVNIGLDLEFYSEVETIEDPSSYTVLLNKYRGLPEDYVPDDLTPLSINKNYKLRAKAAESYEQLQSAALLDHVVFYPFSAYRSKEYQNGLYTRYVNRDGKNAADTYSARPRHSEHELGLAVDIRSDGLSDNLTEEDYEWMLNNSYKYGFIVRYAKGTTPITGYIEEPWHLRYLGVDIATDVHEKGITFDEYYDLYLKNNET